MKILQCADKSSRTPPWMWISQWWADLTRTCLFKSKRGMRNPLISLSLNQNLSTNMSSTETSNVTSLVGYGDGTIIWCVPPLGEDIGFPSLAGHGLEEFFSISLCLQETPQTQTISTFISTLTTPQMTDWLIDWLLSNIKIWFLLQGIQLLSHTSTWCIEVEGVGKDSKICV